jgi:hypothetical protein
MEFLGSSEARRDLIGFSLFVLCREEDAVAELELPLLLDLNNIGSDGTNLGVALDCFVEEEPRTEETNATENNRWHFVGRHAHPQMTME